MVSLGKNLKAPPEMHDGAEWKHWSVDYTPKKARTASIAPSPKRKVPASKARSLRELATVATVAPTNANKRNLKRIGSASIEIRIVSERVL